VTKYDDAGRPLPEKVNGREWCPNSGARESATLPGYGTCRDCGLSGPVKKSGRLNQHKRPKWVAGRRK
jgi:hypothetical protein